jgi:uncharacterized protein Usg
MSSATMELKGMASTDFARQIAGYGLTTAGILYRLPDHPSILQEFIWQDYDLAPRFPELNKFLAFWQAKLDGKLFRITVTHKDLIGPADLSAVSGEFRLQ